MTAIVIQSSFVRTFSEINDIPILEKVRNAIKSLFAFKQMLESKQIDIVPLLDKVSTGHSLASSSNG